MPTSGRPVTLASPRFSIAGRNLAGRTSDVCPAYRLPCAAAGATPNTLATGGTTRTLDDILAVASHQCQTICVTGGEPLAQKACLPLLTALCDAGYSVSLETSGALDIGGVDPRVSRIVDLKAPGSGEARNLLASIALLTP